MSYLYHTFLYDPLFNGLIFLYNTVAFKDLGIAIILLTIIIRVILYPLFYKSFKNQTIMQKLQPTLQQIQHDHKENKEEQARRMMALYREHQVNPFSSFFLIFLQLPVLIALYQVFSSGITDAALSGLYSFVTNPGQLTHSLLGLIDLEKKNIVIVILSAVFQYYQTKMSLPKDQGNANNPAAAMGRNMAVIGPLLTVFILGSLPAAIGVYWLASSVFSLVQQWYINKGLAASSLS